MGPDPDSALQSAADPAHHLLRFALELTPGHPHDSISGGLQQLISPAVSLKGRASGVRFFAIGFDDEHPLVPDEVHLESDAVEVDPRIRIRERQAAFDQPRPEARLEPASEGRQVPGRGSPWRQQRA